MEYIVRRFDRCRDLDAVIECFSDGFGATVGPLFQYSDREAIEDMVMTDYRSSSVALVAEADGEARGVLFGALQSGTLAELRYLVRVAAFMVRRLVLRRTQMRPFARAVLWHSFLWDLLYYVHGPRGRAAEVTALSSREGWRGGIGRALMDAFVEEAKACGLGRVDVQTDSELNWGFYERYGFRRVAQWPHHAYDLTLPDRDVTAFVYSLDI